MSFSSEQDVRCPCGEEFEARLWSAVNAQDDPPLREEILAGQLNVVRCPICSQMLYAERFLLYHDPAQELMAFVYPKQYETEKDKWRQKTGHDFAATQQALPPEQKLRYDPLSLFGMDELVDLLTREQDHLDEGDVLDGLAASLKLEVRRVHPALARQQGVPSRLPLSRGGGSAAERLREGLKVLAAANDRLRTYTELLRRVEQEGLDLSSLLEK